MAWSEECGSHLAGADVGDGAAVEAQRFGVDSRDRLLPHRKPHAHAIPARGARQSTKSVYKAVTSFGCKECLIKIYRAWHVIVSLSINCFLSPSRRAASNDTLVEELQGGNAPEQLVVHEAHEIPRGPKRCCDDPALPGRECCVPSNVVPNDPLEEQLQQHAGSHSATTHHM